LFVERFERGWVLPEIDLQSHQDERHGRAVCGQLRLPLWNSHIAHTGSW
jgi:hypothetical protein